MKSPDQRGGRRELMRRATTDTNVIENAFGTFLQWTSCPCAIDRFRSLNSRPFCVTILERDRSPSMARDSSRLRGQLTAQTGQRRHLYAAFH